MSLKRSFNLIAWGQGSKGSGEEWITRISQRERSVRCSVNSSFPVFHHLKQKQETALTGGPENWSEKYHREDPLKVGG